MSAYTIEPFDASRRGAYLRLLRDAWGDGAMQGDAFDWWFQGNPEGSLMSIAVIDGEVAGVASHTLARLSIDGAETVAQYSVHAVTAEHARGLGIFRGLEHHHEELGRARGSACVLAFASDSTSELFLGPLGWSRIDRTRVWARPLRGLVSRRLGRTAPPASDARGTARLERFGDAQEDAYRALAPGLGNHVVRRRSYLQWRYLDSPRPYQAFASADGFAVVGRVQRGRIATGLLMELMAPPEQAPALLSRCLRAARNEDLLVAVPSRTLPRSLLARFGFAPVSTRLDFMGHGLAAPLAARAEDWTISLGDTDFF